MNAVIEVMLKMTNNVIKGMERISYSEIRVIFEDDSSIHFRIGPDKTRDLDVCYVPDGIVKWNEAKND